MSAKAKSTNSKAASSTVDSDGLQGETLRSDLKQLFDQLFAKDIRDTFSHLRVKLDDVSRDIASVGPTARGELVRFFDDQFVERLADSLAARLPKTAADPQVQAEPANAFDDRLVERVADMVAARLSRDIGRPAAIGSDGSRAMRWMIASLILNGIAILMAAAIILLHPSLMQDFRAMLGL